MKSLRVFVFLSVFSVAAHVRAEDAKWYQISTPHFLLFTDTTQVKGEKLIADFERRLAGFEEAFGKARERQLPIEVFLFRNHDDYLGVMPKLPLVDGVAPPEKNAYLLKGPDRVFIVAKDKSAEDIENDVDHALGHVFFEHDVIWRPFWLNEGVAEYVRKLGRNPDTKAVSEKDAFSVEDLLTIAPSATYQDSDSGGAFRTESFRLVRLMLREKPQALRDYMSALGRESGRDAKLDIDLEETTKRFSEYVETALPLPPDSPVMKSSLADAGTLAVHRGDVLLAAEKTFEATRYYNGTSPEARAARAILTRFSRPQPEAVAALSRAAQELSDNGLVQYHFGALPLDAEKQVAAQAAALQRAIQLLPALGRAHAELARVYALTGKASQAIPLVDKAIQLEPEYADHFYEIRADVLLALNRYDDAFQAIKTAEELPHADRKTVEAFTVKVSTISRKIEVARRTVESKQVDRLREDVESRVNEREPVKPPTPVAPVREGSITYQISATTSLEVVKAEYPEYPETVRKMGKSGKVNLRIEIASDGSVKSATVATSQLPELNAATIAAAKKWTFKLPPRPRTTPVVITLSFIYQLQ
jgi:TonB family protein